MSCVLWLLISSRQLVDLWNCETSQQIAELNTSEVTQKWQQSAAQLSENDLRCSDSDNQPHNDVKLAIMLLRRVVTLYEMISCECKVRVLHVWWENLFSWVSY